MLRGKGLSMKRWQSKKYLMNLVSLATVTIAPLSIIMACGQTIENPIPPGGGGSGDSDEGSGGPDQGKPDVGQLELNQRIARMQQLVQFNNRTDLILKTDVKRQAQKDVYQTEITAKYGNAFKYPAFDFSYEQGADGMQGFYQEINGELVNAMDLVYNERVSWVNANGEEQRTTYSNPAFILNEIKNGTFKKHPAADRLFAQQIDDSLGAVIKGFSIGGNIRGQSPLGLYLAPGEVATIKFSQKTLDLMQKQKINDLTLMINGSFWDNYAPTDAGRISNRYPFMMSEFKININDLVNNNGEFQFGSPFGGTIDLVVNTRLKTPNSNPFYPSYENFEFQISGALETLLYVHGKTTKADWDAQIEKIRHDEIQAPNMAIDFPYGAIWFQATGVKQFVGINFDKMIYPEPIMNRWTDFLFLSNMFASRDVGDNLTKIHFRFNDDIKSGGAAWGGGNQFKAPLSEAANGFLKGDQGWTISGQWLIFHEINHNFEQNEVLFRKRSHGETNQVSMFNLSLISDDGRFRNPYNWTGNYSTRGGPGWNRVQSGFASNRWMQYRNFTNPNQDSEYEIQNLILQLVGSFKFLEYVQFDAASGRNSASDWTGFKEIVELSEFFKINFWPAMQKFSPWWNDSWPTDYASATIEQKQQIDQLNQKYKAFDFVANVYATGNYIWDTDVNDYVYTSDMQVPIDVGATGKYYFDFEKGINSANPNFKWNDLEYQATTKLGGTLKVDPNNNKVLIYTPPQGHEGEIDEFDMAIRPDYQNVNDNATYVDRYGFKIKMFLNPRGTVVSLYQEPISKNSDNFATDEFAYMTNENNISFRTISDIGRGIIHDQLLYPDGKWPNGDWQRMKVSFDFVAPQAGTYKLSYHGDARVFVTKDNDQSKIWFDGSRHVASQKPYLIDQPITLNQGENVHFDFYINANPNKTKWFKINAIKQDTNESYNIYQNSTVGNLKITNQAALSDERYQYQHRQIDLNQFQTKLFGNRVPNTSWGLDKSDEKQGFTINFKEADFAINENYKKTMDAKLSSQDGDVWEVWGPKNGQTVSVTFTVDFNQPQTIGALITSHVGKHPDARPTKIKISDQDGNVLYDGGYGVQFNDRGQVLAITNFDDVARNVSQLTITITNETVWGANQSALILDHITFSNQQNVGLNKVLSMLDPTINYYGDDWKRIANDPDVILSNVNFGAIATTTKDHYLEFNLFANGFDLIGQQLPNGGTFELYINDKLIDNYTTSGQMRNDNAILATYQNAVPTWMKIKIVNKSEQPLRLNYIQTYGKHVEWKA